MASSGTFKAPSPTFSDQPPSAPTQPPNDDVLAKSAKYFFGFLVAFLISLLLLAACAVASRRYIRRTVLLQNAGSFSSGRHPVSLADGDKPPLFEVCIDKGRQKSCGWECVQPLAASSVRSCSSKSKRGAILSSPALASMLTPPTPFSPLCAPRTERDIPVPTPRPSALSPEEVQVAFLVLMPSQEKSPSAAAPVPVSHFGVANVPWDGGEL